MSGMLIKDEDSNLYMEKYLAKELREDIEFSPVIILDKKLEEELSQYEDEEQLIIKYSIDSPKKIVEIKSCSAILDEF